MVCLGQDLAGRCRGCGDAVFNAAALDQVPSCGHFPEQAIRTNIDGPGLIVQAIREGAASPATVVGVSTDKACKPVNVMGMTKALQERIFIAGNLDCPGTRFVAARYGNVMASRGSVIPLFREQIGRGGPVTITTPEMTRFLMTLDQAVDAVFAALRDALPGEIPIPRVPSALVTDVAAAMIGERPIETRVTGIRPGEKVHEILVSDEEAPRTVRRGDYLAIRPMLPELAADAGAVPLDREFSSADHLLGREEVRGIAVLTLGQDVPGLDAETVPFGHFDEVYDRFFNRIWLYLPINDAYSPAHTSAPVQRSHPGGWDARAVYEVQNIEAQMSGAAVVGHASNLIPELYDPGSSGFLFPDFADPLDIAERLERLIAEYPLIRRSARAWAMANVRWSDCIRRWERALVARLNGELPNPGDEPPR